MPVTVPISELRRLVVERLSQHFDSSDAERMAGAVVFGELIGRPSHGISRILPDRYGATDEPPGPPPRVERTGPSAARITGSPGMLVADMATDLTIELAADRGMATVTTVGSRSTSGSLTYYVERLTNAGLVGIVSANTLSLVTAPGGTRRILGTNPFAIGIPTDGLPFVYDIGTAAVTFGELAETRAAGEALPGGVAVDAGGRPTTDPDEMMDGGALLAFGGHKGLGLSMAIELLNGVLAGADAVGVGPDDVWGHVFVALALEGLGDPADLRHRAGRLVDRIAATPTATGEPIRIPGRRSLQRRDAALARGTVDVDETTYAELRSLVS